MRLVILAACFAGTVWGGDPAQHVSAAMAQRASIQKQRASVQQQLASARPSRQSAPSGPPAWFSTLPIRRTVIAPPPCGAINPAEIRRLVQAAAQVNSISPEIVHEVARQESAFVPCAVSSSGAQGLMQLMPDTADWLGVADPFDPEENMMAGARLLRELLSRYNGNLALALSAYNAGPTRVDEAKGVPAIAETQDYVARILNRLAASGFATSGLSGLID